MFVSYAILFSITLEKQSIAYENTNYCPFKIYLKSEDKFF